MPEVSPLCQISATQLMSIIMVEAKNFQQLDQSCAAENGPRPIRSRKEGFSEFARVLLEFWLGERYG